MLNEGVYMYKFVHSSLIALAVCHFIYLLITLAGIDIPYESMLIGASIGCILGNIAFGGN